ncbi:VWA domain-containing protein [Capnocytophaga canimorsus]|nr:Hypothetical protein Ccan_12590 [Capnocytophaga canimorsus Cc5]ATA91041.1 VWA domain-containing protein [Capnocytophaga canimorsus]
MEKDESKVKPKPQPDNNPVNPEKLHIKGVGLYIMLIDSSGSMFMDNVFPGVPMSRAKMVSAQVASAIWETTTLNQKEDAYFLVMLFDHTLKPFINFMNVQNVLDKYKDVKSLEAALYKEMETMKGATDINKALKGAFNAAQNFINGNLGSIGKVTPMEMSMLNFETGNDFTVPNVRCLIFTDGQHYVSQNAKENVLKENPFNNFEYKGEKINILMGAFHGPESDTGYLQLKSIMGTCPVHGETQFFHFSKASDTKRMRNLFRMSSGPGGLCEKCLSAYITKDPIQ